MWPAARLQRDLARVALTLAADPSPKLEHGPLHCGTGTKALPEARLLPAHAALVCRAALLCESSSAPRGGVHGCTGTPQLLLTGCLLASTRVRRHTLAL